MNSPTPAFAAVAPARAADEIARQIRELVASGQIKPGDRLPSERDLAQRLHVSRNTLREALRALKPGGRLWLVANRHLPYEAEIQAMGGVVVESEQREGYKIIQARKVR